MAEKLVSERELLQRLHLPACPYKSGHSARISTWIRYGLRSTNKSTDRYFDMNDVGDFLAERYKITILDFHKHLRGKEDLPALTAEFTD